LEVKGWYGEGITEGAPYKQGRVVG
jgi:hypothetical protein